MGKDVKHHKHMLDIIDLFQTARKVRLSKKDSPLDSLDATFEPYRKGFSIEFKYDFTAPRKKILFGRTYKKLSIEINKAIYIIENAYIHIRRPPYFSASIYRLHTKGYSEKKEYYYRLVIPLKADFSFDRQIEQVKFTSDLGYISRCSTQAIIKDETIGIACIHRNIKEKKEYLVIESDKKQAFEAFSHKANSVNIGFAYLTGKYAGDQGYFFAYTNKEKKTPKHVRFVELRDSVISSYTPIHSNPFAYSFVMTKKQADKYYKKLRPVNLKEFSALCERIDDSLDFASALMLLLESSVASLLFMPGGFAIVLETLSSLIVSKKPNMALVKKSKLRKKISKELKEVINKYSAEIDDDDAVETIYKKIDQGNKPTNKALLRLPFSELGIKLSEKDLEILETRNDFLHGRVPDITKAGKTRPIERINGDLYYASMRFYTLLNILILKWHGYDNYVINYPKMQLQVTKIPLKEPPYRKC